MADQGPLNGTEATTVKDFHHPYTPYAVQEIFMKTVYQVLEESKIGILESPTGTGKSLSLICGALTWLRDHKRIDFEAGFNRTQDLSGEPEWIVEQAKARERRAMLRRLEDIETRLTKARAKDKAELDRYTNGGKVHKKRKVDVESANDQGGEDQFFLDDYESDSESTVTKTKGDTIGLSAQTLELMNKLGMNAKPEEEEEIEDEMKIFYCSRTHSQLTQFINELRRPQFPQAIVFEETTKSEPGIEEVKHLTLGSRKNLCINPSVNKLKSLTAINERCAELQQSGVAREQKCAFLPSKENKALVNTFRDYTLATIRDIEDLGSLGKRIGICPYYASRSAINQAEIVTLPYPLLLQKTAREALNLSVKGHVVVIDEAHNLMDAIAGIHSVEVSLKQLKRARAQLGTYMQKFRNRLKGKNRVYIAQVVRLIDSLSSYLETRLSVQKADGIVDEKELLSGKGVDQINLFKLVKYLNESKLARKVEGYASYMADQPQKGLSTNATDITAAAPVLHQVSSILLSLTHPSAEGRLFFSKSEDPSCLDEIKLRFLLLDPASHFQDIVSEARAVILAGGTMSPMSDYTNHLFSYLSPDRITTLSCGHVIPKQNLVAWSLTKGPTGVEFEFNYKKRADPSMLDELGRALLNICSIVPDGVVVFFPSYGYLETAARRWDTDDGNSKSILARLGEKKALFREKKEASVDGVLADYAKAIDTGKGGLLLSVVGGKMSEGINFSDGLGRSVVIVGLPFPNINTAEWKAKLEYIEASTTKRLEASEDLSKEAIAKMAKDAGIEFYENACMRAVNQSVGRAIRHIGDYASIVMIDKRYGNERIRKKLPGWIREGLVPSGEEKLFGQMMGSLGTFFRSKKET
ncbi:helicase C-terminal domain-containing protein [Xylogone sp. PMI_703]|nr:helicase C-terminal domain-containing protein [Xylogone sp. PMI_703]